MCKNSRARFDGGCIPQRSCAAKPGFKVVGKGKFGLRCSPAAAKVATPLDLSVRSMGVANPDNETLLLSFPSASASASTSHRRKLHRVICSVGLLRRAPAAAVPHLLRQPSHANARVPRAGKLCFVHGATDIWLCDL